MTNKPESLPAPVRASVADPSRCRVLAALDVLDSEDDEDFDRLVRMAASMLDAPMAVVSLVDTRRQWFKARHGVDFRETPVELSFSAHAIADRQRPMFVGDACADRRFARNPLVTSAPHIRFYAGAPIVVRGQCLGALAVASPQPREAIDAGQAEQLLALADTAAALFVLKDEARVRVRTAAELMKEEWRHALTLEAGRVGSWVWDVRSGEVVANDILRRMFGIAAAKRVTIDDLFDGVRPEDKETVQAALDAAFDDGVDYASEFGVTSGRWLAGRGRVYQRDATGSPLVMMGVCIDITDAREAADHTRHLLRELNHRVKNTLAMIQSLARQTLSRSNDPQSFIDAFSGRLRTLSEAHALLAERDWSGVGLVELIGSQVGPFVITDPRRLSIEGEDVQLPPDHALGLGLILHELASNAVKFGALSGPHGRIRISWKAERAPRPLIRLRWKESGGPAVSPPAEHGFGGRLIQRSLDKILDSQVSIAYPRSGLEAQIVLPLG